MLTYCLSLVFHELEYENEGNGGIQIREQEGMDYEYKHVDNDMQEDVIQNLADP